MSSPAPAPASATFAEATHRRSWLPSFPGMEVNILALRSSGGNKGAAITAHYWQWIRLSQKEITTESCCWEGSKTGRIRLKKGRIALRVVRAVRKCGLQLLLGKTICTNNPNRCLLQQRNRIKDANRWADNEHVKGITKRNLFHNVKSTNGESGRG